MRQGPVTVVEADRITEDAPALAPRPGRALLRTVLGALLIVVVVAVAWVVRYQPLGQSLDGEYYSNVVAWNSSTVAHRTVSITEQFGPHQIYSVGETIWTEPTGAYDVTVGFTMTNVGSRAVTIDGVGSPATGVTTKDMRVFFYSTKNYGVRNGPHFHPFSLPPRGHRIIVLEYTKVCSPSATSRQWPSGSRVAVTFSFLGVRHTTTVPIQPYAIASRRSCESVPTG